MDDRIDPSDVSVVVQGPVTEWTADVLRSVHEHLPGAQVIFSTWAGASSKEHSDLATVVESPDPGGGDTVIDREGTPERPWNTMRLFMSTRAGLAVVDRTHTLKLRSDSPLTSDAALRWAAVQARASQSVFAQRILTCSIATRPGHLRNFLHHPSDCVHFGLAPDVSSLWGGSLVDPAQNASYWRRRGEQPAMTWGAQYANEQMMWLGCLRAHGVEVAYPHAGAPVSDEAVTASDRLIADNFVVLEPWQLGVRLPKLEPAVRIVPLDIYLWFDDWLALDEAGRPTSR